MYHFVSFFQLYDSTMKIKMKKISRSKRKKIRYLKSCEDPNCLVVEPI